MSAHPQIFYLTEREKEYFLLDTFNAERFQKHSYNNQDRYNIAIPSMINGWRKRGRRRIKKKSYPIQKNFIHFKEKCENEEVMFPNLPLHSEL